MAGSAMAEGIQDFDVIKATTLSWTSDDSTGAVTGNTSVINGLIHRVVTNPAAGGTQPDDNYDITLKDGDGVDVMAAALANRDETNSEQIIPDPPVAVAGVLTAAITAAGNSNVGTIVIYYR